MNKKMECCANAAFDFLPPFTGDVARPRSARSAAERQATRVDGAPRSSRALTRAIHFPFERRRKRKSRPSLLLSPVMIFLRHCFAWKFPEVTGEIFFVSSVRAGANAGISAGRKSPVPKGQVSDFVVLFALQNFSAKNAPVAQWSAGILPASGSPNELHGPAMTWRGRAVWAMTVAPKLFCLRKACASTDAAGCPRSETPCHSLLRAQFSNADCGDRRVRFFTRGTGG